MLTLLEIIKKTTEFLGSKGIENPRLNAELMIGHALGLKRMQLYMQFERMLPEEELEKIRPLVRRRAAREPLQYVIGETEWGGLKLKVDRRALIPRPETELLVEILLEKINAASGGHAAYLGPDLGRADPVTPQSPAAEVSSDAVLQSPTGSTKVEPYTAVQAKPRRVLDLGTGTGAIALALAKAWPEAVVVGVDRSAEALALAKENAAANGLSERVRWVESDWFTGLVGEGLAEKFDVVVSNPPYLTAQEVTEAEPEVKNFEPVSALVAEDAGMKDLKTIIAGVGERLSAGGWLALETGIAQHAELARVCAAAGLGEVESRKDLAGRDRFILARKV